MRKWIVLLLMLGLVLCLAGCSFPAFDSRALMGPPTANADQQAIYRLLQGAGTEIAFAYPKNGAHRSAIIMEDFTGDGQQDAVGFYVPENSTGSVEVQFLFKRDDVWQSAATFKNTATQVDRVYFCDLTGDGVNDVLIGWGSTVGTTGRTAAVSLYCFDGGEVSETPLGTYGDMTVTDFDGDGVSELFTVDMSVPAQEEGEESTPARARVYGSAGGAVGELFGCGADNSVSSYLAVTFGPVFHSRPGVVVDGTKADGSVTTQIFYPEDGQLVNAPAGVNTDEYANPFARPFAAGLTARDINGDGILEIPVVSLLPCLPEDYTPDSTSYQLVWSDYRPGDAPKTVLRTLVNTTENYCFEIPLILRGKITAINDPAARTVTYRQVKTVDTEDGPQARLGPAIFSIRAFARSEWETDPGAYEMLLTQNDTVYAMRVYASSNSLRKAASSAAGAFRLLSE